MVHMMNNAVTNDDRGATRTPPAERPFSQHAPGRRARRSLGAFTIVESLVAGVVVLTAMVAIFLVSSRCMGIIRCSQDVAVASAALQERMQQLQSTLWETLTDSDSYQDQVWTDPEDGTMENVDGLLKNATQSGVELQQRDAVESVRISAYRPVAVVGPAPAAAITATRTAATATLTSAATDLVDERMVRIDLRLTWTDGRLRIPRSLGLSAIVPRR